jgi:Fe-Mn family superoxide dismutase
MKFSLPELPYAHNALEPVISEKTISFHYGKHHQTYVTNLNGMVEGTEFENADLDTIVKKSEGPMFNNAAQIWNHNFYFLSLTPNKGSVPSQELAKAIDDAWDRSKILKQNLIKLPFLFLVPVGDGWLKMLTENYRLQKKVMPEIH